MEDDPRVTALREVTEETAGQAFGQLCPPLCSTQISPVLPRSILFQKLLDAARGTCDTLGEDPGILLISTCVLGWTCHPPDFYHAKSALLAMPPLSRLPLPLAPPTYSLCDV